MNGRPGKMDIEYIIGEVARRHALAMRSTDPAFALVTISELVLKSTVQEVLKAMAGTLDRFDTSIQRAENRAGQMLGQQIRESAEQLRKAVHAEIVAGIQRSRSRVAMRFWVGIGLLCATFLCAASFWLGRVLALR